MAEENHNISNGNDAEAATKKDHNVEQVADVTDRKKEIGGRAGPDPTRYGDWEKNGRCIDF